MFNGLSSEEVLKRIENGKVNTINNNKTKSIKEIILSNTITYFNILNISLVLLIVLTGLFTGNLFNSFKNCLFIGAVFCNTLISIYQEIIAKKTIDKMSLITDSKVNVIRDGISKKIDVDNIVLDDIIELSIGKQILTDGIIIDGSIEVNESLLTGESNSISKKIDDKLLSGSFVVSGKCLMRVLKVGDDNYINSLSNEAKSVKVNKSIIFNSFEKLIKILSYIIIPLGILMFINQYYTVKASFYDSVINTVASLIGMIPEGLVLLTSSVMAVSVIRLSKVKVLVQHLYSIESLARVNMVCLDKTGTLTTGNMKLYDYREIGIKKEEFKKIIIKILNSLDDNGTTFMAIREYFNEKVIVNCLGIIPFSSIRKFSACQIDDISYYIGAPEFILENDDLSKIKDQDLYRVLAVAKGEKLTENPHNLELIGYILIEDEIRAEAIKTINYLKEQGIKIKIISGDNYKTVLTIANKIGLNDIKGIDTSKLGKSDIKNIIDYDIFGRVTPENKKYLIEELKKNDYYVAMTGDGVNDVLALREADCAIGLGNGSDAAKGVSELILLDSNFASIPKIIEEGRRTINNIERSSSLLLVKTIYTILLIFTCLFFKSSYFFVPIQLTLITFCTIGVPSFVLALEPNTNLVEGKKFLFKIILKSLPGAITVFVNILIILLCKEAFNLTNEVSNTLCVFLTASTGFIHLYFVSKPFNKLRFLLLIFLILIFSFASIYMHEFFNLRSFNLQIKILFILLIVFSVQIYRFIKFIINYLLKLKKS